MHMHTNIGNYSWKHACFLFITVCILEKSSLWNSNIRKITNIPCIRKGKRKIEGEKWSRGWLVRFMVTSTEREGPLSTKTTKQENTTTINFMSKQTAIFAVIRSSLWLCHIFLLCSFRLLFRHFM